MPLRRPPVGLSGVLFAVAALALAACGTGGGETVETESTPVPTVGGVGYLPDTVPTTTIDPNADPADIVVDVVVSRPVDEQGVVEQQVSELVAGNRVIVLGDSILASTATRFGGELCAELEPSGWAIEINAEPGRFVEFGNRVLDRRLPDDLGGDDDWDGAIVHLGSNYALDQDQYREELDEILSRLAPRPVLLLTVTVYRPAWSEVNDVIDEMAEEYDNVILVDWERTARTPGVLSRDGLHPGDAGEQVLVELIAVALGDLPGAEADCLRSQFTDDSLIGIGVGDDTDGGTTGGSSSGSSGGSSTSGGGSSTSGGSSGSSSGGTTTTTVAGTTGGSTGGSADGGGTDSGSTGGTTTGSSDGGTDGSTDGSADGGTDGSTGGGTDGSADGGGTDGSADGGGTDGSTTGGSADTGTGGSTDGSTTGGSTDAGTTGSSTGGSTGSGSSGGGTDGAADGSAGTGTDGSAGGSADGGTTDS